MTLVTRLLQAHEISDADRVFRLAFGTFLGLPNPQDFMGDAAYLEHRWHMDPSAAFAAEKAGRLVGSNVAICWGSFGFFGPLSVHPDLWDHSIGQKLVAAVVDRLDEWGVTHAGLFTFARSSKHHALYQKFDFWPQHLTVVLAKAIAPGQTLADEARYTRLSGDQQAEALAAARTLTHGLYDGLDLSREIEAIAAHNLGEVVLLWDEAGLAGFAVCHCGPQTEAGSDTCYIKFAAVRSGPQASQNFDRLVQQCEALASAENLTKLSAGVNTARVQAYRQMLAAGYRVELVGVAMERLPRSGHNRPEVFALDDWR